MLVQQLDSRSVRAGSAPTLTHVMSLKFRLIVTAILTEGAVRGSKATGRLHGTLGDRLLLHPYLQRCRHLPVLQEHLLQQARGHQ